MQTAEKGLAWLDLIADGRAGHGSFRNDDNAVTALSAAVARVGEHTWPHRITSAQQAFLEAVSEAFEIELDPGAAEQTLARLGSIARMVGATMSNTANPTMLEAGYKHNVIPGRATAGIDGRCGWSSPPTRRRAAGSARTDSSTRTRRPCPDCELAIGEVGGSR